MKRIGMIGGIGPESTVDYYQRIVKLFQQRVSGEDYPELIINSINMTSMLELVARQNWDELTGMLTDAVNALYKAGADFGFIASNTPHVVFDRVQSASPIPLVSIVKSAREGAVDLGLKKVGLLGTLFTMQSSFYQEEFLKRDIVVMVPNEHERQFIHQKLFSEIERGIFLDDTRWGLLDIVRRMEREDAIDGVVLGCTELPLILPNESYGIRFINTTKLHVDKIMDKYVALSGLAQPGFVV